MLDDLDIHRGVCCPFSMYQWAKKEKNKKNPRTPTSVFISVIRCASRIEHRGRTGRYHGDHELPRSIPTLKAFTPVGPRPTERVLSTCGHAISWEDLKSGPDFKCIGVEISSQGLKSGSDFKCIGIQIWVKPLTSASSSASEEEENRRLFVEDEEERKLFCSARIGGCVCAVVTNDHFVFH